jgi:hypothetical protein
MRGQANVYERCLFYYGHSLAEITTRRAARHTDAAKFDADDENDDAEVLAIAKTCAEHEMKKVPEISIPLCGDTSAAVRRLLLDATFDESPQADAPAGPRHGPPACGSGQAVESWP